MRLVISFQGFGFQRCMLRAQPPEAMAAALAAMVGQPRGVLDPLVQSFFAFYDTTYGRQVGNPLYVQVRPIQEHLQLTAKLMQLGVAVCCHCCITVLI